MCYLVSVMIQFPAMSNPYRVNVSLQQLHYLDCNSERRISSDGTVVYVRKNSDEAGARMVEQ